MLPDIVLRLHRRLPTQPPSWLLCRVLNQGLNRLGPPLKLEEGSCIELEVLDLGLRARLSYKDGRFVPADSELTHLRIAACSKDLYQLARRQEDPDTLFFNRRLILDGDTELGLRIKNWLDSLNWPDWLQRFNA